MTDHKPNGIEQRIAGIGLELAAAVNGVVDALPGAPRGPARLAAALGVDKVLTSRLLRAAAHRDPIAVLHMSPGPDPLRRFASAAARRGSPAERIARLQRAIGGFEDLIRSEAGDRSALNTMLAGWLPEARAEFELRRKQAAFRALSELRGQSADVFLSTAFLHPCSDGEHLDVVWIFGLLSLQTLRPRFPVKFATRRVAVEGAMRRPHTLNGEPVEGLDGLRVEAFCSQPPAPLRVQRVGDVVHYTLAEQGIGPRGAADLVFAEVNFHELPRRAEAGRRRYVFAEVTTPTKLLVFDALVHAELLAGSDPELFVYDTAFEGVADVNNPARDIDRMQLCESVQSLGSGLGQLRVAEVSWYPELLATVCAKMSWNPEALRAYRCRSEYPLYGSQYALAFRIHDAV